MASTETQHSGGIRRLLHLKKDPESQHPLIPRSSAVSPANKKKVGFAFRGLGCASSSSTSQPLVPESSAAAAAAAAVRSSADWQGQRRSRRRRGKKKGSRAQMTPPADVADVSDVWCAPGVVFSAEASVDCVVAHRRDRVHRERTCIARRHGDEEIMSSFLDCPSSLEMRHLGSGSMRSAHLPYMRGGCRRSPAEFDEMMMFQTRVFLSGTDAHDQYQDLRLDVDNMSYEELLELSERIGHVSTGLREEDILHNLRKPKHSFFSASPSQKEWKCIICQEEYEANDDMGRLECGHSYHTYCIKQWLLQKNACPICKIAMAKS